MRGSEKVECTDEALDVSVEVPMVLVGLRLVPLELEAEVARDADVDREIESAGLLPRLSSVDDLREYRPLRFSFLTGRDLSPFFLSELKKETIDIPSRDNLCPPT